MLKCMQTERELIDIIYHEEDPQTQFQELYFVYKDIGDDFIRIDKIGLKFNDQQV